MNFQNSKNISSSNMRKTVHISTNNYKPTAKNENLQKKPTSSTKIHHNSVFNEMNDEKRKEENKFRVDSISNYPSIVDYSKENYTDMNYLISKIKNLEEKLKERDSLLIQTENSNKCFREQNLKSIQVN
jgi:hypothetical protein